MTRKNGKKLQKKSGKSTMPGFCALAAERSENVVQDVSPAVETASSAQPPKAKDGYIIRKIKKPVFSTKSLFSTCYLPEGITIKYSNSEDIPMLINEAVPSLSINSIGKMWREMLASDCKHREQNIVIFLQHKVQSTYSLNSLCIINRQNVRTSAVQVQPSTSNTLAKWILFVASDANPEQVAALSKYNDSKHILNFEDGVLRWTESSGNLDVLRTHIDYAKSTSHVFDNPSDLDKQLVLLCAGNGTGKTTLINRLVNQAKQMQPDLLILLISMKTHSQLLDSEFVNEPLKFLKEAAGIVPSSQLTPFESALDEEKLSVLFDCSDLTSPKDLEQLCKLILGLQKTYVKNVLVVGSKEQKRYLEDQLSTFAIDLWDFSNEDQKCALKNSWKDLLSNELEETRLDEIVQKILQAMSQGTSVLEKEFVGMPLLTHMIAEVFRDLVSAELAKLSQIPEKLRFLELFDQYFERKCSAADLQSFEYIALDIILTKEKHVILFQNENGEIFRESLQGNMFTQEYAGIIDVHSSGRPQFAHKIFADYFAAKWFARSVSRISTASDLLLKPEYMKTLFFYNRILAKGFQLHTSVLNDDLECVKMLLGQCVDINARDLGGRTALHLAAAQGVANDETVTATRNEILDLLILGFTNSQQEDNTVEMTPLHYAIVTQSWPAIDKLIPHFPAITAHSGMASIPIHDQHMLAYIVNNDLGLLMGLCFELGFVLENTHDACKVLLPRACELGSIRVATVLVKNGANLWITYGEGDSPLHIAVCFGHLEIVRLLIDAIKSLHESLCKTLSRNLTFSIKLPSIGDYTNLITKCNDSALDLAMSCAHLDVVKYLLKEKAIIRNPSFRLLYAISNSKCNAEIVKVALDAVRDYKEWNPNQITIGALHSAVDTGNVEMVHHIMDASGSTIQGVDDQFTPLMTAASFGHLGMVKFLLDKVPYCQRMTYTNKMTDEGMTALRFATYQGQAEVVEYLLEQKANTGPLPELIFIASGNKNASARVVELILSVIPAKDRPRYINTRTLVGNKLVGNKLVGNKLVGNKCTAVYMAATTGNFQGLELLIQAGGKVTNHKGGTFTALMLAASKGHLDIVQLLVESAVKQRVSKCDFVNANYNGVTALQLAIQWGHLDVINYLINQQAEIHNYMQALIDAVLNVKGDCKIVDIILRLICESKKKLFMTRKDKYGNTIMHSAAKSGNLSIIVLLVENGGKLGALNVRKQTPLMILASKGHNRIVKYLLDNFDEKKEGMTKLQYINMRNDEGFCAVSIANQNGHKSVMEYITQTLQELLLNRLEE